MEVLAKAEEPPRYADFEVLLRELHGSGFHPDERLVAAVAQTIRRGL